MHKFIEGESITNDEIRAGIRKATTHPTSPVRFLQMRKVAEEIADKKRRNLPLNPELKLAIEPEPSTDTAHNF